MNQRMVPVGLVLAILFPSLLAAHVDGMNLQVAPGPAGSVQLGWSGGQPDFFIYRSTSPNRVIFTANLIGQTQVRAWSDDPEQLYSKSETRSLVEQGVLKLPAKYRVVLMLRDIEVPQAEREVDRVEIFERGREIRKMEREKEEREQCDARLKGSRSFHQAGRRNNPSFRLPVR